MGSKINPNPWEGGVVMPFLRFSAIFAVKWVLEGVLSHNFSQIVAKVLSTLRREFGFI